MQEDIKKYEKVILQLREEFLKNNPDLESNKNDNNNNKKIFKSNRNPENIGSFSNVDLYKIRLRCKYEIEKMVPLDSEEQSLIRCIKFGRKRDFRHFICSFTGNIDLEKIMASYNEFIKSSEVFRSVYMYKYIYNETKFVYNHKNTTFPFSDVSEFSEKEKRHHAHFPEEFLSLKIFYRREKL